MNTNEEIKQEELDVTLPSEILNNANEDDDSDMPLPETADYKNLNNDEDNKVLLPTQKFYELFKECMGKLPYASILKNGNNNQIKLTSLMQFVESKNSMGFTIKEMNTVLSFVATAPFEHVRPLMEIVESNERQKELWGLK